MEQKTDHTQEMLTQLQHVEQNLQNLLLQKQNIQSQLGETESAIEELKKEPKKIFKIIGSIMIESTIKEIEEDLNSKKEIMELKIQNIEKQENRLKEKFKSLQEEILKVMGKNDG